MVLLAAHLSAETYLEGGFLGAWAHVSSIHFFESIQHRRLEGLQLLLAPPDAAVPVTLVLSQWPHSKHLDPPVSLLPRAVFFPPPPTFPVEEIVVLPGESCAEENAVHLYLQFPKQSTKKEDVAQLCIQGLHYPWYAVQNRHVDYAPFLTGPVRRLLETSLLPNSRVIKFRPHKGTKNPSKNPSCFCWVTRSFGVSHILKRHTVLEDSVLWQGRTQGIKVSEIAKKGTAPPEQEVSSSPKVKIISCFRNDPYGDPDQTYGRVMYTVSSVGNFSPTSSVRQ